MNSNSNLECKDEHIYLFCYTQLAILKLALSPCGNNGELNSLEGNDDGETSWSCWTVVNWGSDPLTSFDAS